MTTTNTLLITETRKLNCETYSPDYNDHCPECYEACSIAISFSPLQSSSCIREGKMVIKMIQLVVQMTYLVIKAILLVFKTTSFDVQLIFSARKQYTLHIKQCILFANYKPCISDYISCNPDNDHYIPAFTFSHSNYMHCYGNIQAAQQTGYYVFRTRQAVVEQEALHDELYIW